MLGHIKSNILAQAGAQEPAVCSLLKSPRNFSFEVKTFQTHFPFSTFWGCQCVKLCIFNDSYGETSVAVAGDNKKEEG